MTVDTDKYPPEWYGKNTASTANMEDEQTIVGLYTIAFADARVTIGHSSHAHSPIQHIRGKLRQTFRHTPKISV